MRRPVKKVLWVERCPIGQDLARSAAALSRLPSTTPIPCDLALQQHDRPAKGVYSQSRSRRCTDLKGRHMGDRQGPLLRIPALAALMRPCMSRREC
ncbi:MAG: hypothetical protein QGF90_01155, partial [Gammaproteobacteria bacterium]|nr:hypothetical protein [Gammaproteobacteria bacterium]